MVTNFLGADSFLILVAEFYLGVAFTGWQGDDMVVEGKSNPGPCSVMMVLHTTICIGLPVRSWLAGM